MKRLRDRWAAMSEAGQTLAEFALVAPILVILIFGIIDISRAYNAWVTMQGAAREAARYGVTGRTDCGLGSSTRLSCIDHVAREHSKSLTNSGTSVDVEVRSWDYPSYSGAALEGDPGAQCDALEVEVQYDFEPATPIMSTLIGGVKMRATERMVNEPFGACD